MSIKYLFQLEKQFKLLLSAFLVTLSFGVVIGLSYLYYTTNYSPNEAVLRYNGSDILNKENNEFEIPEYYPKPVSEILVTTHNHVITFSFIFIFVTTIFYFTSIVKGWIRKFLLIEPFISIIISFGALWAMRFLHPSFVYVTVISSTIFYLSFFIMVGIILYELNFKK